MHTFENATILGSTDRGGRLVRFDDGAEHWIPIQCIHAHSEIESTGDNGTLVLQWLPSSLKEAEQRDSGGDSFAKKHLQRQIKANKDLKHEINNLRQQISGLQAFISGAISELLTDLKKHGTLTEIEEMMELAPGSLSRLEEVAEFGDD